MFCGRESEVRLVMRVGGVAELSQWATEMAAAPTSAYALPAASRKAYGKGRHDILDDLETIQAGPL